MGAGLEPGPVARRVPEGKAIMAVRVFQDPKEKKRRGRACPWAVGWRVNGRREQRTVGAKADAEKLATLKRAELLDEGMGLVTKVKWQDSCEEYLAQVEGSGKRPSSVDLMRTVFKTFTKAVKPMWVSLIDAKTLDRFCRIRLKARGMRGTLSPATVNKELRQIGAALNMAKRRSYIKEVPALPKVTANQREKPHVLEEHCLAMLDHCDVTNLPHPRIHDGIDPGDWWRALLVTCWVTGARIDAILHLRWEDLDLQTGRVLSRAGDLKQRKDTRPVIGGTCRTWTRSGRAIPGCCRGTTTRGRSIGSLPKFSRRPGSDWFAPRPAKRGTSATRAALGTGSTRSGTPTPDSTTTTPSCRTRWGTHVLRPQSTTSDGASDNSQSTTRTCQQPLAERMTPNSGEMAGMMTGNLG